MTNSGGLKSLSLRQLCQPVSKSPKSGTHSAEGQAGAIARRVGKGRVVVFGDASVFTSIVDRKTHEKYGMNRTEFDNVQMALNTFHWLSGIIE